MYKWLKKTILTHPSVSIAVENASLFEFSPCLSWARLGKPIIFEYKMTQKMRFLTCHSRPFLRIEHIHQLPENANLFECFPYVCPEPVLAKWSFIYKNGQKAPLSYLPKACPATSSGAAAHEAGQALLIGDGKGSTRL
jgi:hypothetical protein